MQVYQRVLGLAETDGIDVDFETLLVDFSARLDSTTGKLRDIVSKIRKAKPVAAKKKTATTAAMADPAPRTVATSLSPRIYEAWYVDGLCTSKRVACGRTDEFCETGKPGRCKSWNEMKWHRG